MAKKANSGARTAARAGGDISRPELAALLPLVRLLARDAARKAWSVPDEKDQTHHGDEDHPARP